jgi:hypothetical protein
VDYQNVFEVGAQAVGLVRARERNGEPAVVSVVVSVWSKKQTRIILRR